MIVVTGAAGFIGSSIHAALEAEGAEPAVAVDWLGTGDKWRNIAKRQIAAFVKPEELSSYLNQNALSVDAIVHMGAISDTTERDVDRLAAWNIDYSVALWDWCARAGKPLIYASSAATYGAQEFNLDDDDTPAALASLRPLNPYGWSKKAVDDIFAHRAASGGRRPPQWVGLKFFNVYGPNEYHKGEMRSVAAKLFDAIAAGDPVKLFKSYRPGTAHGEQRRDFIYVKDAARAVLWFLKNPQISGIFNMGTGTSRSFLDIVESLRRATGRDIDVEFIDMPEAVRGRYQYFTQANMAKSRAAGFDLPFMSLEEGVADYVALHLARDDRYL